MKIVDSILASLGAIISSLSGEQSLKEYILSHDPKNASDVERLMIEWQKTQVSEFPL